MAVLPWAGAVALYKLRGLTQHRLSPKKQIHSIKHWQAMQILLKFCERTGERVRTADHMEISLNKLLFVFSPTDLF